MLRTETYTLNMGPQHPSTHGVLQVQLAGRRAHREGDANHGLSPSRD